MRLKIIILLKQTLELALAIARHGDDDARTEATLFSLTKINWQNLKESNKLNFIRASRFIDAKIGWKFAK